VAFGNIRGTLNVTAASITNPTNATGSVSVSVGDLIFACLAEQVNLTVTSVTDNLHTPTAYTAQNAGSDAGNATGRAFYLVATSAGTLTSVGATATASSDDVAFAAVVFEGPFTTPPIDTNPANLTNDVASPFTCPATGTLSQADELIVSWMACRLGITDLVGSAPNTTRINVGTSNQSVCIGSYVVAATTTQSPAFTSASAVTSTVLGTASFKKTAAAAFVWSDMIAGEYDLRRRYVTEMVGY
jgi:hypothetical protein